MKIAKFHKHKFSGSAQPTAEMAASLETIVYK